MVKKYYTIRVSRTVAHLLGLCFVFGFGFLLIAVPALDSYRETGSINVDLRAGTDGESHASEEGEEEPMVVVEYDPKEAAKIREAERARDKKEAEEKKEAERREAARRAELRREQDLLRQKENAKRLPPPPKPQDRPVAPNPPAKAAEEKRPARVVVDAVLRERAPAIKLPNGMKGCAKPSPYGRGYLVNTDSEGRLDSACRMPSIEVTRNIRNTTMHSLCAVEDLNHVDVLNSEQRRTLYGQLLVDDAHKFIYCFVPKVACSNWKRVIKYMNGKVPDLETPMKMDHHKDLVTLTEFNDEEVAYRLKNYYKFMFVRDPTERLLSAYRNKFGENIGTYNAKYAPKIIAKYRKPGTIIEGADQSRITFEEFLRFLVDSDTRRMDPHWRPMHELCQPCAIKYDFIGSFEQLSEDASLVLDKIRGQSDAYFPKRQSWYKPTTNDKLEREINNVKEVYMKQVVDKYARDFMLFGYQPRVSEVTRPKRL
ncbi:carbohydrate sulfotransferase 14-like [Diadema antillarum]|uniref:carbohydrate sulfotransferase 14-like n=1 Tax=Diadema antillarum TaxID=105358 RepID=UPI003A88B204